MLKKLIKLSQVLNNVSLKKEQSILDSIIKEAASKFNQLVKMGFSHDLARDINDIARGYSIWLAHEMIKDRVNIKRNYQQFAGNDNKIEIKDVISDLELEFRFSYRAGLVQIMDWVLVGLNGDFRQYKGYNWSSLINESRVWHEGLEESEGD